jgi:hypothetical protein
MAGPRIFGKGFSQWPERHESLTVSQVIDAYQAGLAGAYQEPEERDAFLASLEFPDGADVATRFGLAESGKGKLTLAYKPAYDHWPRCWPSPGQTTGDCVAHAGKNAAIVLIGVEASLGIADEVTGLVEGFPVVSEEAESQGVVACENIYGYRGHSGQGASCSRLQSYVTTHGGILLRKNYPELGIDLTRYDASHGIKWGRSSTPEAVNAEGKKHQIRTATNAPNHEVCRDFLANGYPIWACSSYGWSSTRDENGYSRQSGRWSHSWVIMGYDDRDTTKQKYGFPLALYNHDWGRWNSGGRRIMGTDIDIPEGSMWIDARLLDNCDCTAMSSLNGWRRQPLPDYGGSLAG